MTGELAFLYGRLGPYHVARIAASAMQYPVVAIEFFRDTTVYDWDVVRKTPFPRLTLVPEGDENSVSRVEFARRLFKTLSDMQPSVIALPGWHHYGALLALGWALRTGTPTVVMSATQYSDAPRTWWKESIKRRVVRLFSAALVGGLNQREYIRSLGMNNDRVFEGCDVVDNDYFAQRADEVRRNADAERARLGLPSRYFLATSRFIIKKNLPFLLRGYARYRRLAVERAFDLVLMGDGPLRGELLQLRNQLGLVDCVHLPGFRQYEDLPAYYALAEALVHTSTVEQWGLVVNEAMAASLPVIVSKSCGCVPELVRDDENGYAFDPQDEAGFAEYLLRIGTDDALRHRMGQRSSELVAELSPSVFGRQMGRAREMALSRKNEETALVDWALLAALSMM